MLKKNPERYSSPQFWVNSIIQKVKHKVSEAAGNSEHQKNAKDIEVGKMPSFFMFLGAGQAWEIGDQVWNLYFALIMDSQSAVSAS